MAPSWRSQVQAIVEAIDSHTFGVLMDVGNFQHFGEDTVAAAQHLARWVVHVHLKEARRKPDGSLIACAVGEGDIEIAAVLRALKDSGYDGCLAVEYGAQIDEDEVWAVRQYAEAHSLSGYRRLSWPTVDEDVAYLRPRVVHRILAETRGNTRLTFPLRWCIMKSRQSYPYIFLWR
jgi:hypothetical protein